MEYKCANCDHVLSSYKNNFCVNCGTAKPARTNRFFTTAIKNGDLDAAKWARDNGCEWSRKTCSNAALYGHLNILKWARENGYQLDQTICTNAAQNGHLDILIWARENGCFWNKIDVCVSAAGNGHINILEWLRKNDPTWDYNDHRLCLNSAMKAHQTLVMEWLRENKPISEIAEMTLSKITYQNKITGEIVKAKVKSEHKLVLPFGTKLCMHINKPVTFITVDYNASFSIPDREKFVLPSGTILVPNTCDCKHVLEKPLTVIMSGCEGKLVTKTFCVYRDDALLVHTIMQKDTLICLI